MKIDIRLDQIITKMFHRIINDSHEKFSQDKYTTGYNVLHGKNDPHGNCSR